MAVDIAFVDSPATGATVRLDLSNPAGGVYQARGGLDIGAPDLLGGSESVGSEYGLREITVTVHLVASKAVALTAQAAVARELLRERNYLKVIPDGAVTPVWFNTYRSSPGDITLDLADRDVWTLAFTVDADPFAVGALESLSAVSITNDPAAGTNRLRYTLPSIKGDALTPLIVTLDMASASGSDVVRPLLHSASADTAGLMFWQAESWTLGTDTSAVSDSAASASNRAHVSFATVTTSATRLSSSVTVDNPGRWALYARTRLTSGKSTVVGSGAALTKATTTSLISSSEMEVRAATTTNGTLATAFQNGSVIDGVTLATGDRILLKNQTTQSQNGVYVVAATGAPTRSTDADSPTELAPYFTVYVASGTVNAGKEFTQTTPAPITVGTSNIVFVQTTNPTGWHMVKLGEYAFPRGNVPRRDALAAATVGSDAVGIDASRESGSGSLHIDHIVALPIDDYSDGVFSTAEYAGDQTTDLAAYQVVFDGEENRVYFPKVGATTTYDPATPVPVKGGFPQVDPNKTNVLTLFRVTGEYNANGSSSVGVATRMTIQYRPRYLYLAAT